MLFNSLHFTLFFPLAVVVYFATPHRFRWAWLLATSYYFYMCWKPEYVLLIVCSTLVDYWAARAMADAESPGRRKAWLGFSLAVNLGLLGAFKYWGFLSENLEHALASINVLADVPTFQALLPVGISFYTFQTLSYTVEVYRGKVRPERHLGYFAVYVSFWPQLVAGPIERPGRLLPQLRERRPFRVDRLTSGLAIMLWGFFQKLVIADRLALYVDAVYGDPTSDLGGGTAWLATYAFSFQIYCDFSGYSLIAIGAARVMGIDLMTNFRRPYFARSIGDFWQRWHISLSTWFRDYVYIPLGGSRVKRLAHFRNLLLTFAVSGLWHGAGWTFVLWGALHGTFTVVSLLSRELRGRTGRALGLDPEGPVRIAFQRLVTFHLVALSWVFFRAADLPDALTLLGRMALDPWTAALHSSIWPSPADPWIAVTMVALLLAHEVRQGDRDLGTWLADLKPSTRVLWSVTVTVLLLWLGIYSSQEFIYFQF